MRKIILLLLVIAGSSPVLPAFSKQVKSEIAKVSKATVYLRGAQLTCTSDFIASPGINEFIFEGVSPDLDQNSLQAFAKGNITIMDVKFQMKLNETVKEPGPSKVEQQIKQTNDSLVMIGYEIEELNEQLQGLVTEKNILLNNRMIKGESLRDTLDMFKEAIAFLRTRLADITNESTILKKKLYLRNEVKSRFQNRINELTKIHQSASGNIKMTVPTVVVSVFAEIPTTAKVSISFYVDRAAWLPVYDLRANNTGTIDLNYKAELRQQTGMDWQNVDLTLSTGNPALHSGIPALHPFYLNFVQHHRKKFQNEVLQNLGKVTTDAGAAREEVSSDEMQLDAKTLADYTQVKEGMIQTEYDIKFKYTIPDDDGMHMVVIQNKTMKAEYRHSSVPKLDMHSYLIAELTEMNELNLIPGSSRIYFDGNYVGKSVLNPDAFTDTVQLSLGKDRNVVVNRKKLKDKTTERILSDEKTIVLTYELTVKNNKSVSAILDLKDQIPLSNNPNIKVRLIDADGATLTEESGLLTWKLSLKSMESKKLRFSYEVKMPKTSNIAGL